MDSRSLQFEMSGSRPLNLFLPIAASHPGWHGRREQTIVVIFARAAARKKWAGR